MQLELEIPASSSDQPSPPSPPSVSKSIARNGGNGEVKNTLDIVTIPEEHEETSGYDDASWLSRLSWTFPSALLRRGYKRPLDVGDLHRTSKADSMASYYPAFKAAWKTEIEKVRARNIEKRKKAEAKGVDPTSIEYEKPGLFRTVCKHIGVRYFLVSMICAVEFVSQFAGVYLMQCLLNYVDEADTKQYDYPEYAGYLFAVGCAMCTFMTTTLHQQYFFLSHRLGMNMKNCVMNLIYEHTLSLRSVDLLNFSSGYAMNSMTNDPFRLEECGNFVAYLWLGIGLGAWSGYQIYLKVGTTMFYGLGLIFLLALGQFRFGYLFGRIRYGVSTAMDSRIKVVQELLSGNEVVKMYRWERPIYNTILAARRIEMQGLNKFMTIKGINLGLYTAAIICISMLTWVIHTEMGNVMKSTDIFVVAAYYGIVGFPITQFIPFGVERIADATIACQRIEQVLLEGVDYKGTGTAPQVEVVKNTSDLPSGTVHMKNACFTWNVEEAAVASTSEDADSGAVVEEEDAADVNAKQSTTTTTNTTTNTTAKKPTKKNKVSVLGPLSFTIQPGELIGVTGSVASFKSSLLQAILGEMPIYKSTLTDIETACSGNIAYAPQKPWLFTASIRDNVVLGGEFDEERYIDALYSCGLARDLQLLSQCDRTMISERGANLSGGQRARVGLARAVYARAQVYLFDDVLSAVDSLVASHIFAHALSHDGMLKGSTRIIVTHNEGILSQCDRVIKLEQGKLVAFDKFDRVQALPASIPVISSMDLSDDDEDEDDDEDSSGTAENRKVLRKTLSVAMSATPSTLLLQQTQSPLPNTTTGMGVTSPNALQSTSLSREDVRYILSQPIPPAVSTISEEERRTGGIPLAIYKRFFLGKNSFLYFIFLVLMLFAPDTLKIASELWLADWASMEPQLQDDTYKRNVFISVCLAGMLASFLRAIVTLKRTLYAADDTHTEMAKGVLYAPMSFFQRTPAGRIINRFSKDMDLLSSYFPPVLFDFIQCLINCLGAIVVMTMVVPYMAIVVVIIIPVFVYTRQLYIPASRDVKRLDSTTRSPLLSLYASSLTGLAIIRTYNITGTFSDMYTQLIDIHSRAFYAYHYTSRWLGFRLDCVCAVLMLGTGIFAAAMRETMNPSYVGFALSNLITVSTLFQWTTRQSAECENLLTAAERVIEYSQITPEGVIDGIYDYPECCEVHAEEDPNVLSGKHKCKGEQNNKQQQQQEDKEDASVPVPVQEQPQQDAEQPPQEEAKASEVVPAPTPTPTHARRDSQDSNSEAEELVWPCVSPYHIHTMQPSESAMISSVEPASSGSVVMINISKQCHVLDESTNSMLYSADEIRTALAKNVQTVVQTCDMLSRSIAVLLERKAAEKKQALEHISKGEPVPVFTTDSELETLQQKLFTYQPSYLNIQYNLPTADAKKTWDNAIIYKPPANWPWSGSISIDSLVMAYGVGLPVVLRGLSIHIAAKSKCALVGRTGAGKSTILAVLQRLVTPYYGRVLIDGIDISQIGLHDLRRAVAVIPQSPVVFSGTLRYNLDPFSSYTDQQLIDVLHQAYLSDLLNALPHGLDSMLQEGGGNVSAGEAQLLCFARAILNYAPILILDECTANVDKHTDQLIQKLIRTKLGERTIITVAHRLDTIIDSDVIYVLEAGRVIEQGSPETLLSSEGGHFATMYKAQQAGEHI